MYISKLKIRNFKCFENEFALDLNEGLNILVGGNESGKSTILEAIHLALSGWLNGKYLKLELTPDLFNNKTRMEYLEGLKSAGTTDIPMPPEIMIELYFEGVEEDSVKALLEGNGNSSREKACGVQFRISFNESYKEYCGELVNQGDVQSIPTEYYQFSWSSFARDDKLTPSTIPMKSALIDSSSSRYSNGSDVYIARILKDRLNIEDRIKVDQAYRKLRDTFADDDSIKMVNEQIREVVDISDKEVRISLDISANPWESNFTTCLDDVPFHHIGKGEQCVVKTKLALGHKKSREASLLLLEEPENHLSHAKLNKLIGYIKDKQGGKQIIISTHSSFVANKLVLM